MKKEEAFKKQYAQLLKLLDEGASNAELCRVAAEIMNIYGYVKIFQELGIELGQDPTEYEVLVTCGKNSSNQACVVVYSTKPDFKWLTVYPPEKVEIPAWMKGCDSVIVEEVVTIPRANEEWHKAKQIRIREGGEDTIVYRKVSLAEEETENGEEV